MRAINLFRNVGNHLHSDATSTSQKTGVLSYTAVKISKLVTQSKPGPLNKYCAVRCRQTFSQQSDKALKLRTDSPSPPALLGLTDTMNSDA
jgi:hypothetical protein